MSDSDSSLRTSLIIPPPVATEVDTSSRYGTPLPKTNGASKDGEQPSEPAKSCWASVFCCRTSAKAADPDSLSSTPE